MSRVEVRESDDGPTVAILRFRVAQEASGEIFPLDGDFFQPGTRVAVDLAAPGGLTTRMLEGFVTHLRPHFEGIEANCYVEVLAMDAVALLDAGERVATYEDVTDAEAATAVFDRYGLRGEVADTPARHQLEGQLLTQRESDWRFLRRLARRNGFCCYFEPDANNAGEVVAYFRPRALTDPPQADLTILREGANLKWIDFQHTMTGPVGAVGAAIDPLTKRLVRTGTRGAASPMGSEAAIAAVESGLGGAGADVLRTLLRDPVPADTAISQEGVSANDAAGFILQARGELDPALYRGLLRARRPVLIKGVGRRLAGSWYARSVRTVMDEGALTQTFVAERNALDPSGSEDFGQVAEEVQAQ
nr:contractile injection system protein, VgrG/Pvc8 family [Pyxidicoccus fallax]